MLVGGCVVKTVKGHPNYEEENTHTHTHTHAPFMLGSQALNATADYGRAAATVVAWDERPLGHLARPTQLGLSSTARL